MSLLQYGFKRQKINDNLTRGDEENEENPQVNSKNQIKTKN